MKSTQIQWTHATVNFWQGCKKVSPGCKYCYMHRDMPRWGKNPDVIKRSSDSTFHAALKWNEPRLIFTCSWSDFFIEDADEWRVDAWDIIRKTPQHAWQILTKRPERIAQCLPPDWNDGWDNVWLGVSVENEDYMHRAELLASIPAKIRFISAEPLLGPLDINLPMNGRLMDYIHWVIIGGESGHKTGKFKYRPCEAEWIRSLVEQVEASEAGVFVKQTGTYLARQMGMKDRHGGNIDEFPEWMKVRKWPS